MSGVASEVPSTSHRPGRPMEPIGAPSRAHLLTPATASRFGVAAHAARRSTISHGARGHANVRRRCRDRACGRRRRPSAVRTRWRSPGKRCRAASNADASAGALAGQAALQLRGFFASAEYYLLTQRRYADAAGPNPPIRSGALPVRSSAETAAAPAQGGQVSSPAPADSHEGTDLTAGLHSCSADM